MTRHVVAKLDEVADGSVRRVEAGGKAFALVRRGDAFFALVDRCPHGGAQLSGGRLTGIVTSDGPGDYKLCRADEMLKCPWHGWEFDVATGQSWSDPKSTRTRAVPVESVDGTDLVKGPYVADTVPVAVEGRYIVLDLP